MRAIFPRGRGAWGGASVLIANVSHFTFSVQHTHYNAERFDAEEPGRAAGWQIRSRAGRRVRFGDQHERAGWGARAAGDCKRRNRKQRGRWCAVGTAPRHLPHSSHATGRSQCATRSRAWRGCRWEPLRKRRAIFAARRWCRLCCPVSSHADAHNGTVAEDDPQTTLRDRDRASLAIPSRTSAVRPQNRRAASSVEIFSTHWAHS